MPTYQPRGGWGVSRLSPASLPASSHLGTDIALRLRLGWGTWCAASSWRHLLGLKWCRASQPPPEQEGTHYCPPTPWLAPGGIMLGTSALAVARVQLCLWPGAGTGWQLAVPCVWCWLCVQPCQALQPIVHPGATVQPVYPQPTHIWGGATREQHSWAGVSPCAKGDPVGQPSLAIDLTRGVQAPSRAGVAVGSHSRTRNTHALLLVASLGLVVWLAHHLTRTHVGDMAPGQSTGVPPSPPTPRLPSAVPVPVLLCWSGRYLTARGS